MPTLSDCRFDALRGLGFSGSTSDMLLQWLQQQGATSNSIPDAWREMLDNALGSAATGHRNDDWYTLLGDLGYEGSMNDRELAFWCEGGGNIGGKYVNYSRDANFPGDAPQIKGDFGATYVLLENDFSITFKRVYDSGLAASGLVGSTDGNAIGIQEAGNTIQVRDPGGVVHPWTDILAPLNLVTGDEYELMVYRDSGNYGIVINNAIIGATVPGSVLDARVYWVGVGFGDFEVFAGAVYNLEMLSDVNGSLVRYYYDMTDTADNDKSVDPDTEGNGPDLIWISNELEQNWVPIMSLPPSIGFYDPDAAVIGYQGCIDKFSGTVDTGSMTVLGTNDPISEFHPTKGFRVGLTESECFQGTEFTDAIANGFTLYFEVESYIFANDWIYDENDRASLVFSGGAEGRGLAHFNSTEAWNVAANNLDSVKTRSDVMLPYVGVYYSWDPLGDHAFYVDRFPIQKYPTVSATPPPNLIPMGNPALGAFIADRAYRRNFVLWNKPLRLADSYTNKEVTYISDSMGQWGDYQSGSISNDYPPVNDPNNNPPLTGYIGGPNPSLVALYELKNESTNAFLHKEFTEKNLFPADERINNYGRGLATVSPLTDLYGSGTMSDRIDAALGIAGEPTGGALNRAQIWIVQLGTNDVSFVDNIDPPAPVTALDQIITTYLEGLDRIIDENTTTEVIYALNIVPRYDQTVGSGHPELGATYRQYWNIELASRVDGYRGVTKVVNVATGWTVEMTLGLNPGNYNHPGPLGCRHIAERIGELL